MSAKDDVIQIIKNRTSITIGSGNLTDITQANLDLDIDAAIRDYSMDEPKIVLVDKVPADLTDVSGVKFYELTSWDADISSADDVEIEFPVDQAERAILRRGVDLDWEIVERPTGAGGAREWWVKFMNPPSGSPGTWRLRHPARFSSIAESATLADLTARGVQMVGLLASVYAAMILAAKFGKTSDPSIVADVVDYRTRSSEWREMAKKLFEEYEARLDRPSKVKRPGMDAGIVDLDLTIGQSNRYGRNYLVHRKRFR